MLQSPILRMDSPIYKFKTALFPSLFLLNPMLDFSPQHNTLSSFAWTLIDVTVLRAS